MNFDDQHTMPFKDQSRGPTLGRRYSSSETIELETRYIEQIMEGVENLSGDKSLELHISPMEVECDPCDLALALQRRLKETNATHGYVVEFAYHECNGLLPDLDAYVFKVKKQA